MPFQPYDIYTASGSASLFNSWTTPVTKFDPSSFYNWEQDNEPIHDLEERTYMNWEHAGFHTSTVPGMVFTVSADATAATLTANSNIFTSVSAAVEALPSDIRFPILMEIANYGSLEELNLKNINIGYGGSLEIINRNFVKAYAMSGGPSDPSGTTKIDDLSDSDAALVQYKMINSVSSLDISSIWTEAKAVHIDSLVMSSVDDRRLYDDTVINSVFQPFASGVYAGNDQSRLSVGINGVPAADNKYTLTIFEEGAASRGTPHHILTYDVSAKDSTFRELLMTSGITKTAATKVQGMLYGNHVTKLRVHNCNGPIYIRNFFINSSDHDIDGVQVFDSNDIWIENCASINNKVGFNFNNSKVRINRGIAAYRNYGIDEDGYRKTREWSEVSGAGHTLLDDGAGIKALNSEIVFNNASSIYGREGSDKTTSGAFENEVFPSEFLINFSRNSNGIILDNSVLRGGWAGTNTNYFSGTIYNVELSNEYGILSRNSTIDLDGRLKVYSNKRGMLLENSKAVLNECVFKGNQHEGLQAVNSTIQYNKNLQRITNIGSPNNNEYQFDFSGNGRHLVLDQGSTFVPTLTSSMGSHYGQMRFKDHHGTTLSSIVPKGSKLLSPVEVTNNSKATFVHPIVKSFANAEGIQASLVTPTRSYLGECLSITNNSKALLQGSKNGASVIYGSIEGFTNSLGYKAHSKSAGVYVGNNSELECNGPTVMFNFAVDALAENNSVLNFNPPKTYETGGLDVSGWDLDDSSNHTSVELHSVNSCLVAKNNSTINMKDLGDYHAYWTTANASAADYDTGVGGFDISSFVSGGSMQFYPNPVGETYYDNMPQAETKPTAAIINERTDYTFNTIANEATANPATRAANRNYYLESKPFETDPLNVSSTAGGNCLRALGGSQVNVLNVNFPAGWWNASGLIYDVSGAEKGAIATLCNQLFIWNIADNSRLNAAFCSVSGLDPRSAGYNGPSATYSGTVAQHTVLQGTTSAVYGAPSSTPDTSSLSILDFYGQGQTGIWPIAQFSSVNHHGGNGFIPTQLSTPLAYRSYGTTGTSLQNRGPFRLYVSVDPLANFFSGINLVTGQVTQDDGFARQLYAQGYNLSGDVSAGVDAVSAVYGHAIRNPHSVTTHSLTSALSGFFYNKEMVDPTTYNRIILDESAAHIFANAKNGAMGTSNRAKICKIYVSRTGLNSEAASLVDQKAYGRGYTSPDIFDIERSE